MIPGAQGKILAVLAETTADLNLRALARLSGVSIAQASRVLPGLVELGIVVRHDVPPSALFRLEHSHVAARAVLALANARETVLTEIGRAAAESVIPPVSVIVFGSFARGEATRESDIDVVVVRPSDVDEDDERWTKSIQEWRATVSAVAGNPVEVLEVAAEDVVTRLLSGRPVWRDIRRDGRVVYGKHLDNLTVRHG